MKARLERARAFLEDLFSDREDLDEPGFDPVHLAGTVLGVFAAVGALYWLLWTLLVYEGGLLLKLHAAAAVLLTDATPSDFGWDGYPYAMGVFEGLFGNLAALALTVLAAVWLRRLYKTSWRPAAD